MVKEINSEEFKKVIKEGKVLVDCFATWCGPCKMLSPIIDELSKEEKDIKFYKLDIDQNEDIAMEYKIMSIPDLLYFEEGKLKKQIVGLRSKDEIIDILGKD